MNGHQIAVWAAVSAVFGSLLANGAIDFFSRTGNAEFAGSVLIALITAGGVYAKQRLDDAKQAKGDLSDGK